MSKQEGINFGFAWGRGGVGNCGCTRVFQNMKASGSGRIIAEEVRVGGTVWGEIRMDGKGFV